MVLQLPLGRSCRELGTVTCLGTGRGVCEDCVPAPRWMTLDEGRPVVISIYSPGFPPSPRDAQPSGALPPRAQTVITERET